MQNDVWEDKVCKTTLRADASKIFFVGWIYLKRDKFWLVQVQFILRPIGSEINSNSNSFIELRQLDIQDTNLYKSCAPSQLGGG